MSERGGMEGYDGFFGKITNQEQRDFAEAFHMVNPNGFYSF